ncbi:MAG: hypothetical protein IBJ05_08735 [Blastomonas sp.]|nr:hypothetical protein [Blastomonas sp.]
MKRDDGIGVGGEHDHLAAVGGRHTARIDCASSGRDCLQLLHELICLRLAIGDGLVRERAKPTDEFEVAFHIGSQLTGPVKVDRLRLIMGTSMGCMHGFVWGQVDPGFVRAMMPMACLPMPIAGHNRMWRKAAIEGIKADPAWQGGNYTSPPIMGLRVAASLLQVAGFAPLHLQKAYGTRDAADNYITQRIEAAIKGIDANDTIYQIESSRNYDPSKTIEKMTMPVTWINSSDDFINPWDYGVAEDFGKRLPDGKYLLIKATDDTRGHGTHTWAKFWKDELVALLARSEK